MAEEKYPTITVIIPTFNSSKTIDKCLSSVRKQVYPQEKIEIIIVDGGSKDSTREIAFKYKVIWKDIDPKKQNVEYNKSIGIHAAKGELLLLLDHDNILPNKKLLNKMIKPFQEHKEVVGVETLRYHYDKNASLLDRYFALFGVNDPLAFYLGKADRMTFIYDGYAKKYDPVDLGSYFLVKFFDGNVPTIGANGFMVRRRLLLQNAQTTPGKFFPIDVNVDLIRKGFNTYAFVKDSVSHLSGRGGVRNYLKRRVLFMKQYHFSQNSIYLQKGRRYSLYEKKDFWKLIYFILISITFAIPLVDSIRGYFKIQDRAWFLNPFICFSFVVLYGYATIDHQLNQYRKKLSVRV